MPRLYLSVLGCVVYLFMSHLELPLARTAATSGILIILVAIQTHRPKISLYKNAIQVRITTKYQVFYRFLCKFPYIDDITVISFLFQVCVI